ncbi:MAG: hypothetical protein L3J39_15915 [Verrucomicrobiales bacterium]|nr:hypothetical protein [Verrucomicrobiales bacterium]
MNDSLNLEPNWADSLLVITAYYGSKPARWIGQAKGSIEEGGICFLGDIALENEIVVPGGFLGMCKRKIQIRGNGFGKQLLDRFEQEMSKHGAGKIQGNLVPETADKLGWLIGWYRDLGYEFRPGETVGEWAPPDTAGIVSKVLPTCTSID